MKRSIVSILLAMGVACTSFAADFSGEYHCHLIDHIDGAFEETITLKLNPAASFEKTGYASYDAKFSVPGIPYGYTGIAAARGNDLAVYFESTGANRDPNDRGVGIASVIVDQDKSGKSVVTLHKFYYEMSYKNRSNYGFEECKKVS